MMILEFFINFFANIVSDPLAQGTGFVGMVIILTALFQKEDRLVKKLMLLSAFFWGAHFYFLGVYSGLAAVCIWVIRIVVSAKYQKSFGAFVGIVILTLIVGYFTVDGYISSIPIVASIIGAYAFFFLEKIKLRLAMVANSQMFLIYHFYIGSVSGVINEVFAQIILGLTIYRMLHPQGGMKYYAAKVKDILWKRSRPDYDRFIFIHDIVLQFRKKAGQQFLKLLHLDLHRSIRKRKWIACSRFLKSQKDS